MRDLQWQNSGGWHGSRYPLSEARLLHYERPKTVGSVVDLVEECLVTDCVQAFLYNTTPTAAATNRELAPFV